MLILYVLSPVLVLHVNLAATWFLVGLIWLVQRVHYPLFRDVGTESWPAYHARHMRGISVIVAPAMLIELGSAVLLAWKAPIGVPRSALWTGLAAVVLVWLTTATLQVPAHRRLGHAWLEADHRRLVTTNWLRTALWTGRGLLMSWCALQLVR